MRRIQCVIAFLAGITVTGISWAGSEKVEPQLRLELDLVDGSHVIGKPEIDSVPVQTSYAKIEVPLKQILTMKIDKDHEMGSIDLQNGDKLKGVINLEPLKLETVFGKVKIGVENIKELSVTVCGGTLPDILEQGLVLHYSFDKDQGGKVMDESGRRNNGTVHGAKWERLGSGGMYDFQGSPAKGDYIEVPNSESLVSMEKTRQLTFALWIKPRTVRSYFPELICKGGNQPPDAYDGYELILEGSSTHDIFFVSGPFDILTFNARGRWVNQHLNEWIHIVFAVDASSDKAVCYVNGRPTNDLKTGAGAAPSFKGIKFDRPNNLYIGRADPRHHTNRGYFDGMIGEVEIYNRTLSPEDVCLLYRKGIAKYSLK